MRDDPARAPRRGCAPAALAIVLAVSSSVAAQTAGTLRTAPESYHDTLPGETANGIALDFTQLLPFGGSLFGGAVLVDRAGATALGRFSVQARDLSIAGFRVAAGGGDLQDKLDAAPYHFSNDYAPTALFRGASLHAEKTGLTLAAFGGKNELFHGVRLPEVSFGADSFAGLAGALEAGNRITLDFQTLHTSGRSGEAQPLFGVAIPREAHTYGAGVTARPLPEWILSARGSIADYTYAPDAAERGGRFLSFVTGSAFEGSGWKAQADYLREGVNYVPLSTASVGNREGPYALAQYTARRFSAYGSYASYRNNLEETASIPDLRSRSVLLSPSLRIGERVVVTGSYSRQDLTSTRDGTLSRFSQETSGAEVSFPSFGFTRARYQRQATDEPALAQRLHELELEQRLPPYRGVAVYGGLRYQHNAAGASSLLYRGGIDGSIGEVHVSFDGEWGRDLASASVFSLNRNQTIRLGVSAPLPKSFELRIEGYRNRLSSVVNTESIFIANPTQAELFSFNRTSVLVSVSRLWQWGKQPERSGGTTGAAAAPLGDVGGTVFRDSNANGVRDPGEGAVAGIEVRLDGGLLAKTDKNGRFFFPNVIEGEHLIELVLDRLPVSYNPPAQSAVRVSVARFRAGEHDFGLIPNALLSGKVEQKLASGESKPFAGAVVTLLPKDFSTYTDDEGRFSFENLPPGRYVIRFEEGALPEGAVVARMLSEDIELAAGEEREVAPFVFELTIEEKPIRPALQNEQIVPPPPAVRQRRPTPPRIQGSTGRSGGNGR